ncbi:MAG: nitroreductase family protein, partial [Acidobacteria bacterium]|nr:nitroreductase family protein [Acidobacteriota bacterium]
MKKLEVNSTLCKSCGLCIEVCPNKVYRKVDGKTSIIKERIGLCFVCGQCMAICPTKAVAVEGLTYEENFFKLPEPVSYEKSFFDLIRSRRAVRNFLDKPVPRELLEKIAEAITMAPPGFPPVKIEITIVQNTDLIRKSLQYMIADYDFLYKGMHNPVMRFFIKKNAGSEMFKSLESHIVPMMKERLPGLKAETEDTITRNAPAMILFHASRNEISYQEDINIAVTYGFLAAHALGLGGSAMTLIYPMIERNKALRKLFSIPENNEGLGSMILGYP